MKIKLVAPCGLSLHQYKYWKKWKISDFIFLILTAQSLVIIQNLSRKKPTVYRISSKLKMSALSLLPVLRKNLSKSLYCHVITRLGDVYWPWSWCDLAPLDFIRIYFEVLSIWNLNIPQAKAEISPSICQSVVEKQRLIFWKILSTFLTA